MSGRIIIDVRTPEKWIARHFWAWHGRRTFGVIAAFCPTMWSFGIEILAGYGKGAALIVGPFWIGFATATSAAGIPDTTQDGQ